MPNEDWRFKGFNDTGGAYSRSQSGAVTPAPSPVNAASRVSIPNPSNTNWNSTFAQNNPSSPSGTNWGKEFSPVWARNSEPTGGSNGKQAASPASGGAFNFDLSSSVDRSQLALGPEPVGTTDFYRDRIANADLTKKDHDMYGASGMGFNF